MGTLLSVWGASDLTLICTKGGGSCCSIRSCDRGKPTEAEYDGLFPPAPSGEMFACLPFRISRVMTG